MRIFVGLVLVAAVALASAGVAAADGITAPFAFMGVNSCNFGEPVVITGTLHTTDTVTDNHAYVQTNWQNTAGVGGFGNRYQGNDTTHLVTRATPAGTTSYFQDEFELVSLGQVLGPLPNVPGNPANLIVRIKVGVDKNGFVFNDVRTDCNG
jgi:hypothetical protein